MAESSRLSTQHLNSAEECSGEELPTVSAVIPAHNAADTIERALDSVYAQTYANIIEVIVVDDGSADATAQVVREKFPDVTLIQQENQGNAGARNRGVEAATGEFIAFLDADDEWLAQKTQRQLAVFRTCPGTVMVIADARRPAHHKQQIRDPMMVEHLCFKNSFPDIHFFYGFSGWMCYRCLFVREGGLDERLRRSSDTEFLWRILYRAYGVLHLREQLYSYYPSMTRSTPARVAQLWQLWYRGLCPVVEGFVEKCKTSGTSPLTVPECEAARRGFYFKAGWSLWNTGQREAARQALQQAASLCKWWERRGLRYKMAAWSPLLYRFLSNLKALFHP